MIRGLLYVTIFSLVNGIDFHIIFDENGVALVSGFGEIESLRKFLPKDLFSCEVELKRVETHPYKNLVLAYFAGEKDALNKIPRQVFGSDFQKRVWRALDEVPYGQTLSYKQLAESVKKFDVVGAEKSEKQLAIRAVGAACGKNRLALLIPCHRVLKSDGSIGEYLYGVNVKKGLLEGERQ